jgi:hypothetical protein
MSQINHNMQTNNNIIKTVESKDDHAEKVERKHDNLFKVIKLNNTGKAPFALQVNVDFDMNQEDKKYLKSLITIAQQPKPSGHTTISFNYPMGDKSQNGILLVSGFVYNDMKKTCAWTNIFGLKRFKKNDKENDYSLTLTEPNVNPDFRIQVAEEDSKFDIEIETDPHTKEKTKIIKKFHLSQFTFINCSDYFRRCLEFIQFIETIALEETVPRHQNSTLKVHRVMNPRKKQEVKKDESGNVIPESAPRFTPPFLSLRIPEYNLEIEPDPKKRLESLDRFFKKNNHRPYERDDWVQLTVQKKEQGNVIQVPFRSVLNKFANAEIIPVFSFSSVHKGELGIVVVLKTYSLFMTKPGQAPGERDLSLNLGAFPGLEFEEEVVVAAAVVTNEEKEEKEELNREFKKPRTMDMPSIYEYPDQDELNAALQNDEE